MLLQELQKANHSPVFVLYLPGRRSRGCMAMAIAVTGGPSTLGAWYNR